jgi:hypothetical protein
MVSRRMGREAKMSVVAALRALTDAGKPEVEAIITGTGLGAMSQTKQFMNAVIDNNETMLNPASFIHSTPNTMSSAIAHSLQCNGYNATYSQRELSFETALIDALLLLKSESYPTVLVGGSDEYIPELAPLSARISFLEQLKWGEGSSYFVLSPQKRENSVELIDCAVRFSDDDILQLFNKTMENNSLSCEDITHVFITHDAHLPQCLHAEVTKIHSLVGFSLTASAHALYYATLHLRENGGTVAVVNKGLRSELSVMLLRR